MNAVRALKGVSRAAMHLLAVSMLIAVPGCDEDDKVPERTSGKMERPVCADMSGKDLKSCCDALDAKDPDRASCCERLEGQGMRCD